MREPTNAEDDGWGLALEAIAKLRAEESKVGYSMTMLPQAEEIRKRLELGMRDAAMSQQRANQFMRGMKPIWANWL